MTQGMFTAVSGIRANQNKLNVVANNISNLNTVAFKQSEVQFKTVFSQTISSGTRPGSDIGGTNPKQVGNGVTVGEITQNFSQGGQLFTGRSTDFLIEGEGFFTVDRNDLDFGSGSPGFYLTRAGNFQLDANNNLVSVAGNHVMGTRTVDGNDPAFVQPIRIPTQLVIFKERDANQNVLQTWIGDADSAAPAASMGGLVSGEASALVNFGVGSDGAITATYSNGDRISVRTDPDTPTQREIIHMTADGTDYTTNGTGVDGTMTMLQDINGDDVLLPEEIQLRLAIVANTSGLIHEGGNNFSLGPNSGTINFGIASFAGKGQVLGGALESSNVDVATEFTNMITSQRGLEAASKVLSSQSEVLRTIIGII